MLYSCTHTATVGVKGLNRFEPSVKTGSDLLTAIACRGPKNFGGENAYSKYIYP